MTARNSQYDAKAAAHQRFQVQYYYHYAIHRPTKQYLHGAGTHLVKEDTYAWSGYPHQFEVLKARCQNPKMRRIMNELELVPLKEHKGIEELGFASQKENLEDFFNDG